MLHSVEAGNDPVGESGCGITVSPDRPRRWRRHCGTWSDCRSDERHAMGRRGREFVLAHHTYPVLARRFIEAIESHEHRNVA